MSRRTVVFTYRWDEARQAWREITDVAGSGPIVPYPLDDVASLRLDLSECVVRICLLDLPGDEKDALNRALPWRLRDARAPR